MVITALMGLLMGVSAHARTVYDDTGAAVTLTAPAQRIVALSPAITENLFAIGAGSRIIGTSTSSDYPAAAQAITVVSDYQSMDLEKIARLKPDVIIAWQGGQSPAQLAALEQLHIPIFYQRVRTLTDIPSSLMRLAQLTGLEVQAAPNIVAAYQKITLLRDAPQPTLTAFYQVWHSPLMTLNHTNWVSDALKRCGASNPYDALPLAAPTVGMEDVLQHQPSLLLSATPDGTADDSLALWTKWPDLPAIKLNGLIYTDADAMNRSTLRTLDAAVKMCTDIANVRARL